MTRMPLLLAALLLTALAVAAPAQRNRQPSRAIEGRPELFENLVRCRGMAEAAARLQCFDAAAAALDLAAQRHDVVVVDRAQVRESRRRLFGIALPRLPIFGGGDNGQDDEEVRSIDSTVASASQDGYGHWMVHLADGSFWVQTDDQPLALRPRPGQAVTVTRAALGSFMMRVNRQPGVRVRRQL